MDINISEYITIATALYTVASVITRITPTKKDDEIMGTIGKVWHFIFEATRKK